MANDYPGPEQLLDGRAVSDYRVSPRQIARLVRTAGYRPRFGSGSSDAGALDMEGWVASLEAKS
jgi:hypothetical protein